MVGAARIHARTAQLLVAVQDPGAANTAGDPLTKNHACGQCSCGCECEAQVGHADDELVVKDGAHAPVQCQAGEERGDARRGRDLRGDHVTTGKQTTGEADD